MTAAAAPADDEPAEKVSVASAGDVVAAKVFAAAGDAATYLATVAAPAAAYAPSAVHADTTPVPDSHNALEHS